jgi:hypothetical protein
MRGIVVATLIGIAFVGGSACAVNAPEASQPRCRVIGGEALPADLGGADALCAAIEQAAATRAPGVKYSAEVRVLPRSRLVAMLTADGRKLPDQKFAAMDREITRDSLQRFAEAIAAALSEGRAR